MLLGGETSGRKIAISAASAPSATSATPTGFSLSFVCGCADGAAATEWSIGSPEVEGDANRGGARLGASVTTSSAHLTESLSRFWQFRLARAAPSGKLPGCLF